MVLDASVTAAWCFDDDETQYARRLLRQAQNIVFHVPSIWPLEMANVLLVSERRKRITPADTGQFVGLLAELAIQVEAAPAMSALESTLSVARMYGLSSYDAAYLELALRKAIPLSTLDEKLRAAAERAGVGSRR